MGYEVAMPVSYGFWKWKVKYNEEEFEAISMEIVNNQPSNNLVSSNNIHVLVLDSLGSAD